MTYEFASHALPPFDHQREHVLEEGMQPNRALWWEQGTAKTRPIIDTFCMRWELPKEDPNHLDTLVVVAVPGGERNWANIEVPKWMPDRVRNIAQVAFWQTGKASTKRYTAEMENLTQYKGPVVLTVAYPSVMTEAFKKRLWKLLRKRKVMMVLDESSNIATPGAKRTIRLIAAGAWAKDRRVLDGTPVAEGPFNAYAQVRFLDPTFWDRKGIGGYMAFKTRYGRWFTAEDHKKEFGFDPGYDRLIEYQNLEELTAFMYEVGTRKQKDQVLDLPPKVYMPPMEFELTKEQRNLYDQLAEDFCATMTIKGRERHIDAELAIQRISRFQQIVAGYVRCEAEEPIEDLPGKNPRLDLMEYVRDTIHEKTVIWSKFTRDIDKLMDLFGDSAVRYDGTIDDDEAERAKNDFQDGDKRWFISNVAKGSTTLTLTSAHHVYYYSNSMKVRQRLQSEDRNHRAGLQHSVDYTDIVARNTVDDKLILPLLAGKLELSKILMGDNLRAYL